MDQLVNWDVNTLYGLMSKGLDPIFFHNTKTNQL